MQLFSRETEGDKEVSVYVCRNKRCDNGKKGVKIHGKEDDGNGGGSGS